MPTLSPASSPAPHLLPVNSLLTSHLITLHSRLQKSSGPNAFTLQSLPVPSPLNIPAWRQRRFDYPDKFVCGFLEFSWPVSHTRTASAPSVLHESWFCIIISLHWVLPWRNLRSFYFQSSLSGPGNLSSLTFITHHTAILHYTIIPSISFMSPCGLLVDRSNGEQ